METLDHAFSIVAAVAAIAAAPAAVAVPRLGPGRALALGASS